MLSVKFAIWAVLRHRRETSEKFLTNTIRFLKKSPNVRLLLSMGWVSRRYVTNLMILDHSLPHLLTVVGSILWVADTALLSSHIPLSILCSAAQKNVCPAMCSLCSLCFPLQKLFMRWTVKPLACNLRSRKVFYSSRKLVVGQVALYQKFCAHVLS